MSALKNLNGIKLYCLYILDKTYSFPQCTITQWMLGSPRGQTVSPSAQKELEDSCSQPADTDKNSDKHEDLNSHRTQQ